MYGDRDGRPWFRTPQKVFSVAFVVVCGLLGSAITSFNLAAGLGFLGGELTLLAGVGCYVAIAREEREGKL